MLKSAWVLQITQRPYLQAPFALAPCLFLFRLCSHEISVLQVLMDAVQ